MRYLHCKHKQGQLPVNGLQIANQGDSIDFLTRGAHWEITSENLTGEPGVEGALPKMGAPWDVPLDLWTVVSQVTFSEVLSCSQSQQGW